MTPSLTLRYEFSRDNDEFGWLEAEVELANFSGRGGCWMQWQHVAEFGEQLAEYPIHHDKTLGSVLDANSLERDDPILGIEIGPGNKQGELQVMAFIVDYYDKRLRVHAAFTTHYPDLQRFRDEIALLMKREAEQAVLTGRPE